MMMIEKYWKGEKKFLKNGLNKGVKPKPKSFEILELYYN
jgi:hypothetical protein